jgi:phosphoribosylanthranilate isomerase
VTSSRRTRVKFCGMTSADDVALAVAAGADAVGVILAPSPRRVALERLPALAAAIPPLVSRVGVVTGPSDDEAALLRALGFTLQFSGDESPEACERAAAGEPYIKVFHVDPAHGAFDPAHGAAYERATWMFDTRVAGMRGGSGVAFDWQIVAAAARLRPTIVSGGLGAENVGDCIRAVRPYAVDVRSGIETQDAKDPEKMTAFARAVARADVDFDVPRSTGR